MLQKRLSFNPRIHPDDVNAAEQATEGPTKGIVQKVRAEATGKIVNVDIHPNFCLGHLLSTDCATPRFDFLQHSNSHVLLDVVSKGRISEKLP